MGTRFRRNLGLWGLLFVLAMADMSLAVQPARAVAQTGAAPAAPKPAPRTAPQPAPAVAPDAAAAHGTPSQPEAEYKRMLLTSQDLRDADQTIRETLAEAASTLPKAEYQKIVKQHQAWRQKEFFPNVRAYKDTGLAEAEAWAQELGNHADALSILVEAAHLRCNAKGVEGVYTSERKQDGGQVSAALLLKQVDADYSVSIIVEKETGTPPKQCTFSGTGTLRGKVLTISIEDQPDTEVVLTLDKHTITVKANSLANTECDPPLTLDGTYVKEGCSFN